MHFNDNCDISYTMDFVRNLQSQVNHKLAKVINQEIASKKNDLDNCFNLEQYIKLAHYKEIIQKVIDCDDCYQFNSISDIVSKTKETINKL